MAKNQINDRKKNHMDICLSRDVSSGSGTGFDRIRLMHSALPEIDLEEVDPSISILGKTLAFPLLISSMTGGTAGSQKINQNLALAAEAGKVALGLGSQRAALEDSTVERTFKIRSVAPSIPIFANLGAVQLNYSYGLAECQRVVEMAEADALILHLNPLQEALQPEGDTRFKGLLKKIESLCRKITVPVIAKEVGFGVSPHVARLLIQAGVWAIDIAGAGGTSWSQVERFRSASPEQAELAAPFRDWGIPTSESIRMARKVSPKITLIASGGIRSGVDMVKSLVIGADFCGIALPFLEAANHSAEKVETLIRLYQRQLRVAMFSLGVKRVADLRSVPTLEC